MSLEGNIIYIHISKKPHVEYLGMFLLGGGFKYFIVSTLLGEDFQFDEHIFQMGWFNHQPV